MTIKRRRGDQKGNQNARKHDLYSSRLTPEESCQLWNITRHEAIDPAVAVFRIKLLSLLLTDPANEQALRDAIRMLTKWYTPKSGSSPSDKRIMRNIITNFVRRYSVEVRLGIALTEKMDV